MWMYALNGISRSLLLYRCHKMERIRTNERTPALSVVFVVTYIHTHVINLILSSLLFFHMYAYALLPLKKGKSFGNASLIGLLHMHVLT